MFQTAFSEKTDIRDGICAYLMGGIGNQLFILAAALQQARRLDCPLYIDVSKYHINDPRDFGLGNINLPGRLIDTDSPWAKNGTFRKPKIPFTDWPFNSRIFREKKPYAFQPEINNIRPGTTLFGYFQSTQYFSKVAEEIFEILESSLSMKHQLQEKVVLHARRGDYLSLSESNERGITSSNYFTKGLRELSALTNSAANPVLFTDSPNIAFDELSTIENLQLFDNAKFNDLETLILMSRSDGLVMSNSTFSWWAGWLSTSRSATPVVAPKPWVKTVPTADSLLLKNWITLPI